MASEFGVFVRVHWYSQWHVRFGTLGLAEVSLFYAMIFILLLLLLLLLLLCFHSNFNAVYIFLLNNCIGYILY
jgi:hypothetical protein